MAATDQTYRNQRQLDIWFAVSSLLMLGSILWMFAQDYYAAFKPEQRVFRDVESEMNLRLALEQLPDDFLTTHGNAVKEVKDARAALEQGGQADIDSIKAKIRVLQPQKENAD